jgi:general secretion pathway protein A
MYLEHYKLKELPFLPSPDSRFLYLSDQVSETLQKCIYIISNRIGPLYCAGPIGTGKTTLAKRLYQQLEAEEGKYLLAYMVIPPKMTLNSFLRLLMDEFGIKRERSYEAGLKGLAAWLVEQVQAGVKPLVIMDEAQNLSKDHLQLLHFVLNYETYREKLLQMVLFGQTELANSIERFPEIKSRMYPAALAALNRQDMEDMIRFRWQVAGGKAFPFTDMALDELYQVSLGLPREIVKTCDLSLLHAFSNQQYQVEMVDIVEAADQLGLRRT